MKIKFVSVIVILLLSVMMDANAQDKRLKKELDKEYKKKLKEYKSENWKITGTSRTLEVKLLQHYELLKDEDNKEMEAYVSKCISINVCQQTAINNALTKYASLAGTYLRGRVTSELSNDQSSEQIPEFDRMYAAYERLVAKEIKGELQESYSLVRDKGSSKEYRTFFIVNEKKASNARIRAMEQAFNESQLARENATKISSFIQEGFELNKN